MYDLKKIEAFVFDLDGVFYKSDDILRGGKEMIRFLQSKNIPFAFYTNNSRKNPDDYVEKLAKMQIDVKQEQIFTAGSLAKEYINRFYPQKNLKIYGSWSLKKLFNYIQGDKEPDVVLIGMENSICLKDLSDMKDFAQEGKQLLFTNPDSFIPTNEGFEFECGLIIDILEKFCVKKPVTIGKPSTFGYEVIVEFLNIKKQNIAMVGDTYETDIKGAKDVGMIPIHLNTSDKNYNKNPLKSLEFKDLEELLFGLKSKL